MNDDVISADGGDADTPDTPALPAPEPEPARPARSGALALVLIAAVAVAAMALSAYLYSRTGKVDELDAHLNEQLSAMQSQINEMEGRSRSIDDANGALTASLKKLETEQGMLRGSIDSMFRKRRDTSEDWALAEVEHLLVIATQDLSLDGDVNTALAAMQSADDRLRNMSDPALIGVRSQLLSDISSLKSVNQVDIPGMAMYMADIINRVERLPLKKSESGVQPTPSESGDGAGEAQQVPVWKRLLRTVWHELKGLVVISREKDAGVLSLVPEQRYYLYQNLRMELDAARLAIIRRDSANLRASVDLVQTWMDSYFDVNDAAVANIMDSLRHMSGVKLRPQLPDISSSLETLRAYIRERAAPKPEASPAPEAQEGP